MERQKSNALIDQLNH
jgi:hypothetical protein